jgi:dolichol-phosphate mannosyltransferase
LKPRLVFAISALLDLLVVVLSLHASADFKTAQLLGFAASATLILLHSRPALKSAPRALLICGLALCVRGGVVALLWQRCEWPVVIALLPAVIASSSIMLYGAAQMKPGRWMVALIGITIALRLLYAGSVELMPEETYYWNYARHLDIGYLDHPPMIAWLIRSGVTLFGDSAFGVRFAAMVSGLIASVFIFRLTRNVYGAPAALGALTLAQALPFFFLAGMISTPDAPLVAAWAAALYFLERALVRSESGAWWRSGVALGLGLLSKYTILVVGAATALRMVFSPSARRWWLRYEPYLGAVLALLIFSPVIIWNAQHEWASFSFQTTRRLAEAPRFSLHKLIASAMVLITPIGLIAAIPALRPRADGVHSRGFLSLVVLLPIAIFTLYSLRHEVKLDWTGAPWVGALPLFAFDLAATGGAPTGLTDWLRRAWPPTLAITVLLLGSGLYYLALGFPGVPTRGPMELVPVGWRDLSTQVFKAADEFRSANGAAVTLVGLDRYAIASELSFYAREQHRNDLEIGSVHLFEGMGLMYERWAPAASFDGRNLLLLAQREGDLTSPYIDAHVARLGPVKSFALMHDGRLIRNFYYRFAFDYQSAVK